MEFESGEIRDVRRVLWRWGRIDRRIDELMEQMRVAVNRAQSIYEISGSRVMDGQPHGSGTSDPVFQAVEKITRMRELFAQEIESCEAQIKEAQAFKFAMNDVLKKLSPAQQEVIRLRYWEGHHWPYVGYRMHMEESTARKYERAACKELVNFIQVDKVARFFPFS